ncbi:MAG TPA: ribosome recycling factor [Chloroflexota bacterium]|jgi:ribosome recycling factor
MPTDAIFSATEAHMKQTIEALQHDLSTIRTGRASPNLLDRVLVDYYGSQTPVSALATISVPEARLIAIQPWDKQAFQAIEKAIQKSDLGLTPSSDGTTIRLAIPELTDERRQQLAKMVQKRAEEARVAVRNARRDGVDAVRKEEREKKVSEDESHRGQEQLQKLTDRFIGEVDQIGKNKEREIMDQ